MRLTSRVAAGRLVMGLALGLALIAGTARADGTHDAETRAIAKDFVQILFVQHDVKRAYGKYMTPDFIQHNPDIKNGMAGDDEFLEARREREPEKYLPVEQWRDVIDHLLVDDKYFAVHHHVYTSATDRGRVFLDIWRVENGKIVEHWDVIQPVPEKTASGNPMWGDLVKATKAAKGDPSPESVIRGYMRVGLAENDPRGAAERFLHPNVRQHSPSIGDGQASALAYFANRYPAQEWQRRISTLSHMIVDGDLVLIHRHVRNGPTDRGSMYADLFRVRKGKIAEHWDVIQPVPPTSVNGNTMW